MKTRAAVTYEYNKHVRLVVSAAVFWPGDGAGVVAQCANAAGGGWLLDGPAAGGCDPGVDGAIANERADDEAINIDTELKVQF